MDNGPDIHDYSGAHGYSSAKAHAGRDVRARVHSRNHSDTIGRGGFPEPRSLTVVPHTQGDRYVSIPQVVQA
jgi:hypothetical protein